jgi:hypothetical protein
MALAPNSTIPLSLIENDSSLSAPLVSYTSQGFIIALGQPVLLSKDASLWRCTNCSDQSALVWTQMQDVVA